VEKPVDCVENLCRPNPKNGVFQRVMSTKGYVLHHPTGICIFWGRGEALADFLCILDRIDSACGMALRQTETGTAAAGKAAILRPNGKE
jgi:hypothetical protein